MVELFASSARRDERLAKLLALAEQQGLDVQFVDAGRLNALAQSATNIRALLRWSKVAAKALAKPISTRVLAASLKRAAPPMFLLLDQIQDPHNLGACIRSADAFGADAVVLPKHGSAPLSAVALKAASGATETTPVCYVNNLVQCIRDLCGPRASGCWRRDGNRRDAVQHRLDRANRLGHGQRRQGLRRLTRERCDALVAIPMMGAVESLNVSVATAVCLYATQAARANPAAVGKSHHKAETRK